MPKFQVVAYRSTVYEVEVAENGEEAIDLMMAGEAKEVDGTTHSITATELCPKCEEPLDDDGKCNCAQSADRSGAQA